MSHGFESGSASLVFDTPLKKPPKILLIIALVSIGLGTFFGISGLYGINTAVLASNSQQYFWGFVGYFFCAVLPIVLFQAFSVKHSALSKASKSEPYDNYSGISLHNIFKRVLAIGLLTAALSVWVFLQPIAEKYAG